MATETKPITETKEYLKLEKERDSLLVKLEKANLSLDKANESFINEKVLLLNDLKDARVKLAEMDIKLQESKATVLNSQDPKFAIGDKVLFRQKHGPKPFQITAISGITTQGSPLYKITSFITETTENFVPESYITKII
jgi:hypothetical protein